MPNFSSFSVLATTMFVALIYTSDGFLIKNDRIRTQGISGNFFCAMAWKGDRPPLPNMEFLDQRMDAAWGRGKYRDEVWNDNVNPLNNWWTAYAPSEEQEEAAAQGYDFTNPQAYFEEKNIDYEKALEQYEKDKDAAYKIWKDNKEKEWNDFKFDDLGKAKAEYFRLLKIGYEKKLRESDNALQAEKGKDGTYFGKAQPSLDNEDTGVQWKNDPV